MLEEVSKLQGLKVYTPKGIYLGEVRNVELDISNGRMYGICLTNTNPNLVEHSVNITVPYRWIQDIGDAVILRYFPERVTFGEEETE